MIRVLSVHLDDALMALGQHLAVEPAVVHTVLAGVPEGFLTLTEYDESCSFPTSHAAMRARRDEDNDACAVLGALPIHMDFLDQQYGREPSDEFEITEAIRRLYNPRVRLFAPLGLDHDDHRLVSRCTRAAVSSFAGADLPVSIFFYEELPGRVLHPEQVVEAVREIESEGWRFDAVPFPLPQGDRALKEQALRCYRSQLGSDLDPCLLVPERVLRASMGG